MLRLVRNHQSALLNLLRVIAKNNKARVSLTVSCDHSSVRIVTNKLRYLIQRFIAEYPCLSAADLALSHNSPIDIKAAVYCTLSVM